MVKLLISMLSAIVGSIATFVALEVLVVHDTEKSIKQGRPTMLEMWDMFVKSLYK